MKTIVEIKFGSHLYGTSTPASDSDFKTVFIPPTREILLQKVIPVITTNRPKVEFEKNKSEDVDNEAFAFHRYLELLSQGQTVALDMLFAPEWAMLSDPSPIWTQLIENRRKLISKKSASFVGYCKTQANKYGIRGSRVHDIRLILEWFDEVIKKYGKTIKINDIENVEQFLTRFIIANKMEHTKLVNIPHHSQPNGVIHLECCNRKTPFFNNLKDSRDIYQRIMDNYGNRSLLAEKNEGVDWKALSHAIRVGQEAIELFETGWITFPLPNAKHILDIKMGNIPYNEVASEIEKLLDQVEHAALKSTLQDEPDLDYLNQLVYNVYLDQVLKEH